MVWALQYVEGLVEGREEMITHSNTLNIRNVTPRTIRQKKHKIIIINHTHVQFMAGFAGVGAAAAGAVVGAGAGAAAFAEAGADAAGAAATEKSPNFPTAALSSTSTAIACGN